MHIFAVAHTRQKMVIMNADPLTERKRRGKLIKLSTSPEEKRLSNCGQLR